MSSKELGIEVQLRFGITRDSFIDLPETSAGWQQDEDRYYEAVAAADFEAVQGGPGAVCRKHGLALLGSGVIRHEVDALPFAQGWVAEGARLATCIAGTGFESDEQVDALLAAIRESSQKTGLLILIETHRGSLTQDLYRTQRLLERNGDVRLNLDFSHRFTGLELAAHDWSQVRQQLTTIVRRTSFLHGRVGDRCCMQVALHGGCSDSRLMPFRDIWAEVLKQHAFSSLESELWFVPELLGTAYAYARVSEGREEGDRWQDALLLRDVMTELSTDQSASSVL